MFKLFHKDLPNAVKRKTVVGVTPLGKRKAEEFSLRGPKFNVLAYLAENGPSSFEEIGSENGISSNKVKKICESLAREGFVRRAGSEED